MSKTPEERVRSVHSTTEPTDGDYVLYWCTAFRRTRFNFALQFAIEQATELDKPLVVLEALRCGYQWKSDRFHRFIIDGMADNRDRYRDAGVRYFPYVEAAADDGKGLLKRMAEDACCVITDDYPCFFHPRMIAAAGTQLEEIDTPLFAVDSNGVLPIDSVDKAFPTAHSFRRMLQKSLRPHLESFPLEDPLSEYERERRFTIDDSVHESWPVASDDLLDGSTEELSDLPIDHDVEPTGERGGEQHAREVLDRFLEKRLESYDDARNVPDERGASELSPYLHFGNISSHELVQRLLDASDWSEEDLSEKTNGKRTGWWGAPAEVEAFLDQIVTWRELSFNGARHLKNYTEFESLPDWAQKTLAEHEDDEREHTYSLEQFERAETHDDLWNAAQTQLVVEGRIHNYLRMLWGKKILHWSKSPKDALAVMVELNNKYALDGRDPNSYSGIFWTLGRYDRAWGPERDIFGKVRYMTCENTKKKTRVTEYLETFGKERTLFD